MSLRQGTMFDHSSPPAFCDAVKTGCLRVLAHRMVRLCAFSA